MSGFADALMGALGGAGGALTAQSKGADGWQNGDNTLTDFLQSLYDNNLRPGDGNAVPNSPTGQITDPNDPNGPAYVLEGGTFPQLNYSGTGQ